MTYRREFLIRTAEHVPPDKRAAADAALAYGIADLGLPPITIRWYELPAGTPLAEARMGWTPGTPEPIEIWIRCGCTDLELATMPDGTRPFLRATTPADIIENVLHELHHAADGYAWGGTDNHPERQADGEASARAYASTRKERIHGRP
jgi:hypothetical protein